MGTFDCNNSSSRSTLKLFAALIMGLWLCSMLLTSSDTPKRINAGKEGGGHLRTGGAGLDTANLDRPSGKVEAGDFKGGAKNAQATNGKERGRRDGNLPIQGQHQADNKPAANQTKSVLGLGPGAKAGVTGHQPALVDPKSMEQVIDQPWDFQTKFDPHRFTNSVSWKPEIFHLPPGECDKKDAHKMLLDQVEVWGGSSKAGDVAQSQSSPRILCSIYTYHSNHQTQVKAIKETWASRCDGFVAFSDVSDNVLGTFGIKHQGEEAWKNMWQKSRAIWKYIHHHYREDFDWFLLGGDDIFIIVENLRKYLMSNEIKNAARGAKNRSLPMYLGRRFILSTGKIFNSGGASYVLNKAALLVLAKNLDSPKCFVNQECPDEDVKVGHCLALEDVHAYDTRDPLGRERFHPFTPGHHLNYRIPEGDSDWYKRYSIGLREGFECCSKDSLSFHYVKSDLMRRIFNLVYSCPKDTQLHLPRSPR